MFAVFLGVTLLMHLPVFQGKVPFPADVVTGFPPWEDQIGITPLAPHSDIGDAASIFYPWRLFAASTLASGELPLWNPYILGGTPFLANAQSALFYPPNLIYNLLPMPAAWTAKLMLNLLAAGFLTALFVRSMGGSAAGSIAAGLIYSCCGFVTAWHPFVSLGDTVIWLPVIFLTVHRLCSRPTLGRTVWCALAFALAVLAGHPETAAHLTLAGTVFALWQCHGESRGDGRFSQRLALFAMAGILAVGVTCIQIIPTIEWLGEIRHSVNVQWAPLKSGQLLSFFSRDIATSPNSAGLSVPEGTAYAGMLPLLLAPLALLHRRRREAVCFLFLIAASASIAVGRGPLAFLVDYTPVLNGLKNSRLILIVEFSLAILSGLAITALGEARVTARARHWFLAITALVGVGVALGIRRLNASTTGATTWLNGPESSTVLLAIGGTLLVLLLLGRIRPKPFATAATLLIAVDLLTFRYGFMPFVRPPEIFPEPPAVSFLKTLDTANYRMAAVDETLGVNFGMMFGLTDVGGYELILNRVAEMMTDYSGDAFDAIALVSDKVTSANAQHLDVLNLKYLLTNTYNNSFENISRRPDRFKLIHSHGSIQVFENLKVLPRAFFVPATHGAVQVTADEADQLRRFIDPAFDPERSVVLFSAPEYSGIAPPGAASRPVSWQALGVNAMQVDVTADHPGVLVVSQMFYPGWKATVDGRDSPVLRANYAIMGVALNPGSHRVRLSFEPASLRTGMVITLLALAAAIAMVTLGRMSR